MIKIVLPDSFGFDDPIASLVDVHSKGIDSSWMIKRAAAGIFKEFENIKPDKDHSLIHLIALGDAETYGGNRNGDWFYKTARQLELPYSDWTRVLTKEGYLTKNNDTFTDRTHTGNLERADTFTKFANVYKHHCFIAGTDITLADRRRVPIEQIELGDAVATSEGASLVTTLMQQKYKGKGIELTLNGVSKTVTATSNHPFLAYRREQIHCRHKYNRLTNSNHAGHCKEWQAGRNNITPAYINAGDLHKGDYVVLPIPKSGAELVEPHFARLVGWVASEGYIGGKGNRGIRFTFAGHNKADIASVTECLKENGLHVGTYSRQDGLFQICASSAKLVKRLKKYIIGKKSTKSLTGEVLNWHPDLLRELLTTYVDGDGSYGKGSHFGSLRIRSSSPQMLNILSDIIHILGVRGTVNIDCDPKPMVSPTNGKIYQGNGSGCVLVAAHSAAVLNLKSRKHIQRKVQKQKEELKIGNTFLVRVVDIKELVLDTTVYNFEVEGVHNYIANEVVVHNCNKAHKGDKIYGSIKAAAHNDKMDRVELLIQVPHGKDWDEDLQKMANDQDIPWSMAAKVPYDICSVCGHKSKTRDEYCGHLKHDMTSMLKTGHVIGAVNDYMTFFDISRVIRPADRIAYSLVKESSHLFQSGADLAFDPMYASYPPLSVLSASMTPRLSKRAELLGKLAAMEKKINMLPAKGTLRSVRPKSDDSLLSTKVASLCTSFYHLPDAYKALAEAKICLPFDKWATLTLGKEKVASISDNIEEGRKYLNGAFTRCLNNMDSVVGNLSYDPSKSYPPAGMRKIASDLSADYSMNTEALKSRAVYNTIRTDNNVVAHSNSMLVKASNDVEGLIQNYLTYKLAAVEYIANSDPQALDVFIEACVAQNIIY